MMDKTTVYFTSDSMRFGGDDAKNLTHVFSINDFFEWCQTFNEQKEITAHCGAILRPQFMGTMQVGENLCSICAEQCVRFEREG